MDLLVNRKKGWNAGFDPVRRALPAPAAKRGPRIFGFMAGDEMAVYQQHGLVDATGQPT